MDKEAADELADVERHGGVAAGSLDPMLPITNGAGDVIL